MKKHHEYIRPRLSEEKEAMNGTGRDLFGGQKALGIPK